MTANPDNPAANSGANAVIWVKGMSCPLCANNISLKLNALAGVSDVQVDLGDGRVLVAMSGRDRPTDSQLNNAVRQAGFTPERIEWTNGRSNEAADGAGRTGSPDISMQREVNE